MAPRQPEDVSEPEVPTASPSDSASELAISDQAELLNRISNADGVDGVEQEYHTEKSDASQSEDEELDDASDAGLDRAQDEEVYDTTSEAPPQDASLLPAELLQPLPSPPNSGLNAITIPRDQLTRKQKVVLRSRSRQSKKRAWNRLKQETNGTGVLEAGRVAQMKRGIVPTSDKVISGRVGKKNRPQASGRQQLLEQRKRQVDLSGSELTRPPKKAKAQSKR